MNVTRQKWQFVFLICISLLAMPQAKCKNVRVGFQINYLAVTGIEVALYDYADCNESILDNQSIIIALLEPNHANYFAPSPELVRDKFSKRFGGRYYECATRQEMDEIIKRENIDVLYMLRGGGFEHLVSKCCKNAVHAAFGGVSIHGDVYAVVSQWLSQQCHQRYLAYVPHIVRVSDKTGDLRNELGIPRDAIVFGRHGGVYGFDIQFVKEAIVQTALQNENIYFLFMNTDRFCNLPNVIHVAACADMDYKAKFINSCDAMIHARARGETFGIACGEFSIKNKPILTWFGSLERSHIDILGDKGIYYSDKQELLAIFGSFKKDTTKNWDAYSQDYSPEVVMKKFDQVFIQPFIKE